MLRQKTDNNPISSLTTGPRQSNFELLRLLLMFMVLCIHANFPLGIPDSFHNSHDILCVAIDSLSICAVNCFVMISGWFSIKATTKGFLKFLFQCLFFSSICLIFQLSYYGQVSLRQIPSIIYVGKYHWFVISYMALYLFAPLLNYFVEKASKSQLLSFIILFFTFQVLYGWFVDSYTSAGGFSGFSFFGLYLLARYFRLYFKGRKSPFKPFLLYLFSCLCVFLLYPLIEFEASFRYSNPFVILAALALTICFSRIKIKPNIIINRLAASAFAVYLLHHGLGTFNFYKHFFREGSPIFQYSGLTFVALTLAIILLWYAAGILLDQPRIWLWNRFGNSTTNFVTKSWNRFINYLLSLQRS